MSHYPMPENMTDLVEIFQYADEVTGNYFGAGIIFTLYVIIVLYMHFRGNDIEDCFIVASYITGVTSVFFFIMGLISTSQMFLVIALCVVAAIWSYFNKDY